MILAFFNLDYLISKTIIAICLFAIVNYKQTNKQTSNVGGNKIKMYSKTLYI
nr:unnamed protein product [Moritella viscosa]